MKSLTTNSNRSTLALPSNKSMLAKLFGSGRLADRASPRVANSRELASEVIGGVLSNMWPAFKSGQRAT